MSTGRPSSHDGGHFANQVARRANTSLPSSLLYERYGTLEAATMLSRLSKPPMQKVSLV